MNVQTSPATMKYQTVIALGSNIGERDKYILEAIKMIRESFGVVLKISNFYETDPMGENATFPFLNGAILASTNLEPDAQMRLLLEIEVKLGRERKVHWGNRTIDLDIITIESELGPISSSTDLLKCPHPHLAARDFVLIPACEVCPEAKHSPTGVTLQELLESAKFRSTFEGKIRHLSETTDN